MDLSISFAQDLSHKVQVILRVGVIMSWQSSESLIYSARHAQRVALGFFHKAVPSPTLFVCSCRFAVFLLF